MGGVLPRHTDDRRGLFLTLSTPCNFELLPPLFERRDIEALVIKYVQTQYAYNFIQVRILNTNIPNIQHLVLMHCKLEPYYFSNLWRLESLEYVEIIGCPTFGVAAINGILSI